MEKRKRAVVVAYSFREVDGHAVYGRGPWLELRLHYSDGVERSGHCSLRRTEAEFAKFLDLYHRGLPQQLNLTADQPTQ